MTGRIENTLTQIHWRFNCIGDNRKFLAELKSLSDKGWDFTIRNEHNADFVSNCIRFNRVEVLKYLLSKGINLKVNRKDCTWGKDKDIFTRKIKLPMIKLLVKSEPELMKQIIPEFLWGGEHSTIFNYFIELGYSDISIMDFMITHCLEQKEYYDMVGSSVLFEVSYKQNLERIFIARRFALIMKIKNKLNN
jgi:hypothetical protein